MSTLTPQAVVDILARALPGAKPPVALHQPEFAGAEWEYVKDCLDTGWVSSVGAYVDRFERMLAEACGIGHAVAVVNGTAALHVALKLAGVGPGDEVIVPALTFVATANAVALCGAIPHFAECDEANFGLDARLLDSYLAEVGERDGALLRNRRTGRRIAAIMPVHIFGHPADINALGEVAAGYGLALVEDAAEALGSSWRGRPCGSFGLVSALSFNGNKIATTGGGGAILTDDPKLAARAKHLTTTAKLPHRWEFVHDEAAFNYRLPNLNAALGCAQIELLAKTVERKRAIAEAYRRAFADLPDARLAVEPDGAHSNYWLNALVLAPEAAHLHEAILEATNDAGYQTRPAWRPLHLLAMYRDCPRMDLTVTESLARRVINLPSSAMLAECLA